MANKIPWKPEKSPLQSFLSSQDQQKTVKPIQSPASPPAQPEKDIWTERATWIIVGIFISIGILWLALQTGSSDRRVTEDFDICDGTRSVYCP